MAKRNAIQRVKDDPASVKERHEIEDAQPALIPMTEEEVMAAGRMLSTRLRDLEEMELAHDAERKRFREDESKLRGEISAIASTIRNQGR